MKKRGALVINGFTDLHFLNNIVIFAKKGL